MKVWHIVLTAMVAVVAVAGATVAMMLPALHAGDPAAIAQHETSATLAAASTTATKFPDGAPTVVIGSAPVQPRQGTAVPGAGFDVRAVLADIRALEAFGPRPAGSDAESAAATYLRDRLTSMGVDARIEEFSLPSGVTSRNVVARIPGSSDALLVLGAHMDTKPPSPGANDNASGCAALLEIARSLSRDRAVPTVEIVFFGSEEVAGKNPSEHHFGSRYRVAQTSAADRARMAGMISVDMIGYGTGFHSRTMGRGPLTLSDRLLAHAKALGMPMSYLRDPGTSGWSDHEPYELAGIPASWIEWRDDPVYHTAGDTSGHLQSARIATAGRFVLSFTRSLDQKSLDSLTAR